MPVLASAHKRPDSAAASSIHTEGFVVFEFTHLLTYVLVVLALFLVPGPAVLLILTQSIAGGRKVGLATSLGIAMGDAVHTIMATFGLSALLMTSAAAFTLVKYAGVVYLIYLGIRAWIEPPASMEQLKIQPIDAWRAFRQALLTEVLNPKTALFFLTFLPQFVRPAGGPITIQLLMLGLIFVALSIGYSSVLALSAGSLGPWLARHSGISRWQGKIAGLVYLGLGIRLILQQRA
jgi:threonine/homoserine/homoserine lactone efflux protein